MKVATTQINRTFTNTTDMYMVVGGARDVLFASINEGECNDYFGTLTEAQAEDYGVIKILTPHEEWVRESGMMDVYYDTPEEAAQKAAEKQRLEEIGSAAFFAEMINKSSKRA